jgi:hypothetical protein
MSGQDPREYLNDQEEGTRLAQDGHQARIWTAMPAIIQSIDLTKNTCVCQIAIQGRYEDQDGNLNWVNIGLLQDVPIVFPSAGGMSLTFPIAAGDEVLVVFASRCIDSWWQNGGFENKPIEYRMHDLSDGFAIPGPKSVPKAINGISTTDVQLRNLTGTTFLSIGADGKIGFQNTTTSLNLLLTNLNMALSTFGTACGSATSVADIAAAGTALTTALTAVTTLIGGLLK